VLLIHKESAIDFDFDICMHGIMTDKVRMPPEELTIYDILAAMHCT